MSDQAAVDDSSRFSPVRDNDHAGYIWIATILGLIYSAMSSMLRAHVKRRVYGTDDYLLLLAIIAYIVQCSIVFYGLNHGLAKSNSITTSQQWLISGTTFYASELLSLLALGLIKCSVVALMIRVFAADKLGNWISCMSILVACAIWGTGSMIAIGVNCNAESILTSSNLDQCAGQYNRWRIVTIIDMCTELLICSLPVALTWSLNMPAKIKGQVILAFGFRLPLIAMSYLHLSFFERYPDSPEPQLAIGYALLLQQVMLTWSIISSTIPNMKSFMKSFSMGLSFPVGWGQDYYKQNPSSYPLQTFGSTTISNQRKNLSNHEGHSRYDSEGDIQPILRPDHAENKTLVISQERGIRTAEDLTGRSSNSSQELVITRKVQWAIHREPRPEAAVG